jgi:hypothetical protein
MFDKVAHGGFATTAAVVSSWCTVVLLGIAS